MIIRKIITVLITISILLIVLTSGCSAEKTKYDAIVERLNTIELTAEEISEFTKYYKMNLDLTITDKTLEILSAQDAWPDKMFEFVLLLPAERIPDKIYAKLAHMFLFELNHEQMARFLELCFDINEPASTNKQLVLKANENKFDKIIEAIENIIKNNKYESADLLYRHTLINAVKYIRSPIANNQLLFFIADKDFQVAFTDGDTTTINSLVLEYTAIRKVKQSVTIYKPAMGALELNRLKAVIFDDILLAHNRRLTQLEIEKLKYNNHLFFYCVDKNFTCSKAIYSDKYIDFLTIIYPAKESGGIPSAIKPYFLPDDVGIEIIIGS